MKVLIACEFSAVVRDAFGKKGHDAWSCDLVPSVQGGQHCRRDVREILTFGWDLMIAHPPCTYLCNSGVRWLHSDLTRWEHMVDGSRFFRDLMNSKIPKIAIENPIMHKYAKAIIGRGQDQVVQPWMFGHGEIKATCLWLKNLPKLKPTNIVEGREARIHKMTPSEDRGLLRSITYQGIANAMAEQWG